MENLAISPSRRNIAGSLTGVALAFLWFILCQHLSGEWSVNQQYNYGWFVPFVAAYLFWLRWEDRPKPSQMEDRRWKMTGAIAIAALVLIFPIRLFEIANPDWRPLAWIHAFSVVTLTLTFIWHIGGAPWLRHFAFPIAFFLIAVPWPSPIEGPIVQGLMRFVAAIAAEAATLFGIPAQLAGNLIRLPTGLVDVNEACSGVRSLQTSLMIGLLFGELKRLSVLRRVILVGSAVMVALFANCLRTFLLVWVAATKNISEVDRWHDFAGYFIVAIVFVSTLALAALLSGSKERGVVAGVPPAVDSSLQPTRLPLHLPTSYVAAILVWLVVVEILTASWYRIHETNMASQARWTVRWPENARHFREIKINEVVRSTLRFDEGRQVDWLFSENNNGAISSKPSTRCTILFFRWNPGGSSVLRARAHRPDICLPSAGWRQTSDRGFKDYRVSADLSVPFRHICFQQNQNGIVAHTFFCLQEDKHQSAASGPNFTTSGGLQPDWSYRGRTRAVLNGERNLGQQVLECILISSREIDDTNAEEKFARIAREVIKVENEK